MTPESTRDSESRSGGAEQDPRPTRRGVLLGAIDCPCHGSQFKITNGAVVTGPAPSPLPPKQIKIVDGHVILL